MAVILTIAIIIASLVLVLVVLVQNSKGGGLASNFSSSNQIMGAPKTADAIEKITWVLAGVIIVLSLFSAKVVHNANQAISTQISVPVDNSATPDVQSPLPTQPAEQGAQSQLPATLEE